VTSHTAKSAGISILNEVLGPVMRGPSSSHTAASYQIGRLATALLGAQPAAARITFDPGGSYGQVYRQQGVDLGFAMGILGLPLTDLIFFAAVQEVAARGIHLVFDVRPLIEPDHPNAVDVWLQATDGNTLQIRARSIGGGAIEITQIDGWPILLTGQTYEVVCELTYAAQFHVLAILAGEGNLLEEPELQIKNGLLYLHAKQRHALSPEAKTALASVAGVARLRETPPVAFVKHGPPLFNSAAAMIELAEMRGCSLGHLALAHESALLGIAASDVFEEISRRVDLMCEASHAGLDECVPRMQLLAPTASHIFKAEAEGRLPIGGLHTRAAVRALAAMHVNSSMGVVCAAPTGGSAGVLPGVLATLREERNLNRESGAFAALAAGAIGVIIGTRATFAAEIAGCQVEIGAAGAMAAAAVVEIGGGTPRQAADAAAISFQNTMGSVCDLVQGMVEIPCHTRNAVAASSAFVCADLIMGGYENLIPLDETIDAVLAVGKMLPPELRVTSRGGLAVTPSAFKLRRRQ
jgi:L-serine dehydratase